MISHGKWHPREELYQACSSKTELPGFDRSDPGGSRNRSRHPPHSSPPRNLGPELRPQWTLVALHARRFSAGNRSVGNAGHLRGESPLGGDHGPGNRIARGHLLLSHAGAHGRCDGGIRYGVWVVPHRLDRAERHLHVSADGGFRTLRRVAAQPDRYHAGPPPATAADCLQLRGFLRRRCRIRYAGCGDRGVADRPRLPSATGFGPVAHRQHRAGCLRRLGNAHHRARQGDGIQRVHTGSDGGTHIAVLLSHRTVLADLGLCRIRRHDGNLAGDSGRGRLIRGHPVCGFQLSRSVSGGRGRRRGVDGVPHRLPHDLAPQANSYPGRRGGED